MTVSHDLAGAEWRKSSRSGGSGQCVEVATNLNGVVAVRHSRRPDAEVIIYTTAEWAAFIEGAKDGEFDL
jgi:hypothetical protein